MTSLSKDQLRQIIQSRPPGTTPEGIVASLRTQGHELEGYQEVAEQHEPPGFLSRIGNRIQQAGQGVSQALTDYNAGKQGFLDTTLQTAGNIFSGIVSPATELTSTVVGGALQATGADQALANAFSPENLTPLGQATVDTAKDVYGKLQQAAPQQMKTFQAVGKAGVDALDVYGTGKALQAGAFVVKKGIGQAATALRPDFDEAVSKGMAKGVKPQFRGAMRTSPTALPEYNKKASEAVRQILDNTDSLQYADEAGDIVSQGHAPKNLSEFAQAIDQTKKKLFAEYSSLSQQATGKGAAVDLDDIVDKLIEYADDPVKQLADKSKTDYALKMADQLMKQKSLNPTQTEQLIKEMNQSLAHVYSSDKLAKGVSEVDLSIANALREKLDDAVLGATGGDYQALKNAYGALKTVERDVGHQALKVARQNVKGLSDLTDIFTGGDILAGAVTGNPALLLRGAAGKGIQSFYKHLNSPDATVMRMFNRAGKALRSQADDAARGTGNMFDDFGKLTAKEVASLTPEERATGLIGGSDAALPRPVSVGAEYFGTTPEKLLEVVKGAGDDLGGIEKAVSKAFGKDYTAFIEHLADVGEDLSELNASEIWRMAAQKIPQKP